MASFGDSTKAAASQSLKLADVQIPKGDDWLSAEDLAAITPAVLVERCRALTPLLAARAREAEELGRPVDDLWAAIRRTGVFYHFVPKRYGGLEFSPEAFVDAMLPLAEGCASTGWVAAFCVEHNWLVALFPEETQDELFGGAFPYVIAPGVTQPLGTLKPVDGGYLATGHWRWGTGVMHADWILAAAAVEGESPPKPFQILFPVHDAVVLDTWDVDGMIATGSHDIMVENLFVPTHRTVAMADMREGRAPGSLLHANPIFRMPMTPFLVLTAAIAGVGAARAAVGHFRELLGKRLVFGSAQTHNERPAAQMRLGHADIQARTAEMLIRDMARECLRLAQEGGATPQVRGRLRAQGAYAISLCREAINRVCEAAGSSAHFRNNPLQRAQRDINVIASHVVYDLDAATELNGRVMLGLAPNTPLL